MSDKKLAILIILVTYSGIYFVSYLMNTDILNAITLYKGGFTVSFIGVFVLLITSVLVFYIIKSLRREQGKN